LPEVDVNNIELGLDVLGKHLKAPVLITGMTGGAERARDINRQLAAVAQELGLAMGLGSQRAMLRHDHLLDTYKVRDVAPDVLLFGNIGAVQAAEMTLQQAEDLVGAVGADALCIHLNPGQELIQPEGDRHFKGCLNALAKFAEELSVPIIAKETGCGLSRRTLDKIKGAGVAWVDVSGAGGTTWIGVEALRTPPEQRTLGELLWDWGIPTAASIAWGQEGCAMGLMWRARSPWAPRSRAWPCPGSRPSTTRDLRLRSPMARRSPTSCARS
jgi:isopentenyl-diphosphate delta-isomerase